MPLKRFTASLIARAGYRVYRADGPSALFHAGDYLRHNSRRLEHLASLALPVTGKTVLEVGAGIGDHSHYYLDRGCKLTITEARRENLTYLRRRYPGQDVRELDLDAPNPTLQETFQVVHCYGVLYHLGRPAEALRFIASRTEELLLLETCVSFGDEPAPHLVSELQASPTQSVTGTGCRPTRAWVFQELARHFAHVYATRTQPNHEQFPLDWRRPELHGAPLVRAVFVAAQRPLASDALVTSLPALQTRHP